MCFIKWRAALRWTVTLVAVSHIIFCSEGFVLLLKGVKIAARLTYGLFTFTSSISQGLATALSCCCCLRTTGQTRRTMRRLLTNLRKCRPCGVDHLRNTDGSARREAARTLYPCRERQGRHAVSSQSSLYILGTNPRMCHPVAQMQPLYTSNGNKFRSARLLKRLNYSPKTYP